MSGGGEQRGRSHGCGRRNGGEVGVATWRNGVLVCSGGVLIGAMISDRSERGEPISGDTLLLLFHAHHEPLGWKLPGEDWGREWAVELDTAQPAEAPGSRHCLAGEILSLKPRSVVVLKRSS